MQSLPLPPSLQAKLPFLVAGFLAFLFSVFLYFIADEKTLGIFVGLWVPSIHSLGTLVVTPVDGLAQDRDEVMS